MATMARMAGVPGDTLRRFLAAGYVPQPRQLAFHAAARECDEADGPLDVGFGGARGPGKSHSLLAQMALDDCQRVPGLKCLLLRKVGKAAREAFEDLRGRVLGGVVHEYKRQDGIVVFPNSSRIVLGHFKDEKDIDGYLGLEYDVIGLEEATQLTAKKRLDIKTCLRTSKTNWRPRAYYTTNPGGIGHAWFKELFIKPWRAGVEALTRFVPATVRDNVFVNSDYTRSLEALTGWQRAAWLEGEWDIAAGQFFTTWRYDLHVCASFEIPAHWPVWCALDYGFTHPTVCYLFTEFDGVTYIVAEHWRMKALPPQHADAIKAMLARCGVVINRLRSFVAGADVFANKGDAMAKTIADQYKEQGIVLSPANMDRINGAGEVLRLLGDMEAGIAPKLQVFDTCPRLIECLPMLQHDPHRPEDVLKVNVDEDGVGGDDSYDTARYGCMANWKAQQPGSLDSELAHALLG